MRVAVIADIHGNIGALRAVLSDIDAQGVDHIVVNGDVVNRGPDSVEVLETLLARGDVTYTLGNHDDLMRLWRERSGSLPPDWFGDPFWGATDWSAERLDRAGLLGVFGGWPLTHTLRFPGLPDVRLAHGTPEHYRESLSEKTSPERVAGLAGTAGVLVGSHIHRPARATRGEVLVLNTGAVGAPANGDTRAQYLLLTATPAGWVPEFRAVPYDVEAEVRRFETSGLLAAGGLSARIFRDEVRTARSLYTPYWMWTEAHSLPRDERTWGEFLRQFPPR